MRIKLLFYPQEIKIRGLDYRGDLFYRIKKQNNSLVFKFFV